MERARLILKPKEDLRLRSGHPWVYDNEISRVEGEAAGGAEVEVLDARRQLVGLAFYNPASKIRARLYSRALRAADEAFFAERLGKALEWRRRFFDPERQSLRLAFGEADGLPGLVLDSFVGEAGAGGPRGRWLSAQFLSLGVDARKAAIMKALAGLFPADGVVERSDAPVRAFEGLKPAVGAIAGTVPPSVWIEENGLSFAVDLVGGQKTGWFLDQRSNRAAAARFARGRRVLDAFCNQGGFGLACAAAGAAEVLGVDSSAEALAAAAANAERNGLAGKLRLEEGNAFDFLRALERERERFGLVVLDPPAFAKNRASVESARRGYKDLNLRALKLLEPGGILVTCSCSHWFGPELFGPMLEEAAHDAGRRLRTIEERAQDLDHPIVSGYPESRYLKCFIVEAD
ncbi:MAG TPA: class I SAM-dependent rRNA methyltransferase [Spirochaetales bacterium]|nr:class I SAM-dependent rRNA methyltransferase [Spirochaetales bacterium]HRY54846.1 class I SAM-dependent rRNA methyltransferase [Spirochaetia bacterium]HRZ66275.1 class I SAM-dependent rRNA methyltransferase [Spirochaetia bacterium]